MKKVVLCFCVLVVNSVTTGLIVVNPDGSSNFTSIAAAIDAVPPYWDHTKEGFFIVHVVSGVYKEYIVIPRNKTGLMLVGDGIDKTVITGDRNNNNGYNTFDSATFAVYGDNFVAINITFRNTAGAINGQAVAVRNDANMSVFYKCSFEGFQDTLLTAKNIQFYRECDIYGTVDFIFGDATTVLQRCYIYARLPLPGQSNVLTAQGREGLDSRGGIIIHNSTIQSAEDLSTTKTYLGRPWREYSRTIFMQSFMDGLINPKGWLEQAGNEKLATVYYGEYNNHGSGSLTTERVNWPGYHILNYSEAAKFTVANFLSGNVWLPQTGVPYIPDLL